MRGLLGLILALASILPVQAGRWAPLDPADVRALAAENAASWRRNFTDRHVLPGAGPDGRARVNALALSTAPSSVALREALVKEAESALAQPIPAYRRPEEVSAATRQTLFDTRQELWMRRVGDQLVLFSVAAAIRPDDSALRQRIHDLALAACGYPQWGVREPNQDLAAGHVARGLAIAWSWHRGLWDETEATFLRETVRQRVNTLCGVMTGGIFWAGAYQENHNHVNAAAVGICGVAFLDDLPEEAPLWLATAQLNFEAVARHANADGSSPEGVPYWSYGASYILQYIEGVRGVIDVAPFYAGDWLRRMASHRLHASTPGFDGALPWGDAAARDFYGPHHLLNRLAAEYRDAGAQYLAARLPFAPQYGADVTAWNWLWHDPSIAAAPPEALDGHLPALDVVDTRSGWGAGDYLLAIKSGFTNRNHSHLDAGALAFAFGGEWLLPAPGYGKGGGDKEFWDASGGGRWNYFSNATESHTTLVVNGHNQRWDPSARGTVRGFASAPRALWTEIDLGEAYADTTSIWRRVLHRRGDYILVFDDATLGAPGKVEWLLQVPPTARVEGAEARSEGVAGALTVRLLEPSAALVRRSPLSPKVDVPPGRLTTWVAAIEGGEARFRSALIPRFGGSLAPEPVIIREAGDRYRIDGDGWRDQVVFSNLAGSIWRSATGDVTASARLIAVRHAGDRLEDVFAVDAVTLVLPWLSLAFDRPQTLSATRISDDLWVLTGLTPDAIDPGLRAPWKTLGSPDGRVLVSKNGASPVDYERWRREQATVRDQPGLPVRVRAPLPPAPGDVRVAVEAEAFSAQASGQVAVVDKPGNRGRSLRGFGNDSVFHTLAWKVSVPVAGSYRLRLRYCTPVKGTRLSLLVDGYAPSSAALAVTLPETGGWSVEADNWGEALLAGEDGQAISLPLTAGEHELRLTRPSSALNLDAFELVGGVE